MEAFVGKELDHLIEGKGPIDVAFRAGSLDGIVGAFGNTIEEPIDALFLGGWVKRIIVGDLGNDLFKKVNVLSDISAVNVSEVFDGVSEGLASLLGEAMITETEFFAGAPTIELGSFPEVSNRRPLCTKHCKLVVELSVNVGVETGSARTSRVVIGLKPSFGLKVRS